MGKMIFRKPKFMRNDHIMTTWLSVAESISKVSADSEINSEERYKLLLKANYCLRQAAEAGGFRNVKDMLKYFNLKVSNN